MKITLYLTILLATIGLSAQAQKTISFAGINWNVRSGAGGPGPNSWSNSVNNVWVDEDGSLHLKITKVGDTWYCAEVYSQQSFCYGEYRFYVANNIDNYDKNVVVGLFTYETDEKEIDIEFARWGSTASAPGWYTIQPPPYNGANQQGFALNLAGDSSTHKFVWSSSDIFFQSYRGHYPTLPDASSLIKQWTYTGKNNPPVGNERLHINFWLFQGKPPTNQQEAELIIKAVFVPTNVIEQPGEISGSTSVCQGSSQTYSIDPVAGAPSYKWTLPTGWTGSSTTNSITVTPGNSRGKISVAVNSGCVISDPSTLSVNVTSIPRKPDKISGLSTVCQGQSAVDYTVPQITNATSYIWTLPSGATGTSTTNSISVNSGALAASGDITVSGVNACGEGAISTLAITVNAKPTTPVISQDGHTLSSSALSGNQWYNQTGIIDGETNQSYTVVTNGDFYAIVTVDGCAVSEPSNTISVLNVGIAANEQVKSIKLYPNPVSGTLNIEMKGNKEKINFEILNAAGQVVYKGHFVEKTTVHAGNFTSGVYLVKLENGKTFEFKKIIKE